MMEAEAWIALIPLPAAEGFSSGANVTAESANWQTERLALRLLTSPPHCCQPAQSDRARVALLPLHFTAEMHAARCRRPGGMERLMSVYTAGAHAIDAFHARRRTAGLARLPLVVISSNAAAFDAAGPGFPWSHARNGTPPDGLIRLAPELRYKAGPLGAKLRSASQGFPAGFVVAHPPYGFVAEHIGTGKRGTRRPFSPGHEISARVRTYLDISEEEPRFLSVGGSRVRIASSLHPMLRGFVVIPYGTVHRCGNPLPATGTVGRPWLASFVGAREIEHLMPAFKSL